MLRTDVSLQQAAVWKRTHFKRTATKLHSRGLLPPTVCHVVTTSQQRPPHASCPNLQRPVRTLSLPQPTCIIPRPRSGNRHRPPQAAESSKTDHTAPLHTPPLGPTRGRRTSGSRSIDQVEILQQASTAPFVDQAKFLSDMQEQQRRPVRDPFDQVESLLAARCSSTCFSEATAAFVDQVEFPPEMQEQQR